jgi:nucleotide-binding universal stress UspA family protein
VERICNILAATDYSEHARRAVTRAAMLSVQLSAGFLEIMTIRNTRMGLRTPATMSASSRITDEDIQSLVDSRHNEVAVLSDAWETRFVRSIRLGRPAQAIVSRSREIDADLTVIASRGKSFLTDIFARHANLELVRLAERPLLLVNTEPRTTYRHVLVGVDFSPASFAAAQAALALAPEAQFTFVHAARVANEGTMREVGIADEVIRSFRARACEDARNKLDAFIGQLGPRRQSISRSIGHGHPGPVISATARRLGVDLIAVGKHGRSWIEELLLGSVTQRLLGEFQSDLLIVPPAGTDDGHDRVGWMDPAMHTRSQTAVPMEPAMTTPAL